MRRKIFLRENCLGLCSKSERSMSEFGEGRLFRRGANIQIVVSSSKLASESKINWSYTCSTLDRKRRSVTTPFELLCNDLDIDWNQSVSWECQAHDDPALTHYQLDQDRYIEARPPRDCITHMIGVSAGALR